MSGWVLFLLRVMSHLPTPPSTNLLIIQTSSNVCIRLLLWGNASRNSPWLEDGDSPAAALVTNGFWVPRDNHGQARQSASYLRMRPPQTKVWSLLYFV